MKKIWKYLLLMFIVSSFKISNAQTLEHVYNFRYKEFHVCDLGNNDYKYVIVDSSGFSIYNLDHSPYLLNYVPPVPIFRAPEYYAVGYVTKSLFDCDSTTLEYALVGLNFLIYRTDGTLLFERD